MRFTLNGQQSELNAADVRRKLRDLSPEPLHQYAVRIDSVLYPVKQAFEAATGVTRREFTTETARRHFVALDFEIVDTAQRHATKTPGGAAGSGESTPTSVTEPAHGEGDWHTEARVQAMVVGHLVREGWHIVRSSDTATRERGIDVEATRESRTVAIEVKGFPSRGYADPRRAAEQKRTQPSTQAKVWYSLAILAAMITRTKMPEARSAIALPDFPRYRALFRDTASQLRKCEIELWWVAIDGTVTVADPDR
jgi:hypothetical protein